MMMFRLLIVVYIVIYIVIVYNEIQMPPQKKTKTIKTLCLNYHHYSYLLYD